MDKKGKLDKTDIELFKNTPAWDLVKAIENEDISQIKDILTLDSSLVNYQEPLYGITPIIRAIGTDKYKSVCKLLECGANPDLASKIGTTPLFEAISYRWSDVSAKRDTRYVKLLLSYRANPNLKYIYQNEDGVTNPIEYGISPLMYAIDYSSGYDIVKLLVESGADINFKTALGTTAAIESLSTGDVNSAYYLIVEKKAKVTEPYFYYSLLNDNVIERNKPHYPVDLLLNMTYEIGSDKYHKKMSIVQEFEHQGVSYNNRKEKISNLILRKIKKMHPNDWQEYLDKY
ncbi:MAG TPA: ankyrin repeat domain-containing protein [Nostocaceae cyanobacterium]|nr:ankyrin repeat domain-containing protein [Nostocaceae cyanobacterium]